MGVTLGSKFIDRLVVHAEKEANSEVGVPVKHHLLGSSGIKNAFVDVQTSLHLLTFFLY